MHRILKSFSKFIPAGLFISEFMYFAYIHSWEVDPHHDGIMYTAAVGVFEGLVPNRDFFAQYGPISPIIQGFWFRLTEPNLWSLKLLTSLGLAIIGALVYMGAKRRLSLLTSALVSMCWALTGPFGLPWSSVFAIIFILGSLLLLELILRHPERQRNVYLAFAIGLMLALGTFTRIHTILVYLAAVSGLLLVKNRFKYLRISASLSAGFFLAFGSIVVALAKSHALKPYWDQSIVWASGRYSGGPEISLSFFFNLAWIPIFGIVNLLFMRQILNSNNFKSFRVRIITFGTFLFYLLLFMFSQLPRMGSETLRNPRVLEIIGGQKGQFAFNFTILTIFLILIVLTNYRLIKKLVSGKFVGDISPIIFLLFALAASAQLYPYADEYHIAFVVPVIVVACVFVIPKDLSFLAEQKAFQYLAFALIPALLVHFLFLANIDRYEFHSKTLTGMYGSWQTAKSIDSTLIELEKEQPGIKFDCADGLYAGAGGRYLSIDEKFVTWGPPPRVGTAFNREFLCYADQKTINSYLKEGWRVKFRVLWRPITGHSEVSHWNVLLEKP